MKSADVSLIMNMEENRVTLQMVAEPKLCCAECALSFFKEFIEMSEENETRKKMRENLN